jgi:5-methylcytosine-specific restriction endonuclease McrA
MTFTATYRCLDRKRCARCHRWKAESQFSFSSAARDGRCRHCGKCRAIFARAWYQKDPAHARAVLRASRLRNPSGRRAAQRRYKRSERGRAVSTAAMHRRMAGYAPDSFTAGEWADLCRRANGRCVMCGSVKPLTVDHIIPVYAGGSNAITNIQPLCRDCNTKKAASFLVGANTNGNL